MRNPKKVGFRGFKGFWGCEFFVVFQSALSALCAVIASAAFVREHGDTICWCFLEPA